MPNEESGWEDSTRYSFDYKSLHLVSFPTELFFDEDEHLEAGLDWLENDLAKATEERSERPWIIVFGHRPLYCTIETDSDCTKKAELIRYGPDRNRGLETILSKYNVDMYMR
jgi:hypothetical protein